MRHRGARRRPITPKPPKQTASGASRAREAVLNYVVDGRHLTPSGHTKPWQQIAAEVGVTIDIPRLRLWVEGLPGYARRHPA